MDCNLVVFVIGVLWVWMKFMRRCLGLVVVFVLVFECGVKYDCGKLNDRFEESSFVCVGRDRFWI